MHLQKKKKKRSGETDYTTRKRQPEPNLPEAAVLVRSSTPTLKYLEFRSTKATMCYNLNYYVIILTLAECNSAAEDTRKPGIRVKFTYVEQAAVSQQLKGGAGHTLKIIYMHIYF